MKRIHQGPQFYLLLPFLLLFFAIPYLFDIAYCEELYGTPLSQAALIDGEKVDPSEGVSSWVSPDGILTPNASLPPTSLVFVSQLIVDRCGFKPALPVLLTSRPPPAF